MILDAICQLEYSALEEVPAVFMLRPRSGWAQWIIREEFEIRPQVPVFEFTDVYGNLCQRLVMPAGNFQLRAQVRADVTEFVEEEPFAQITRVQELPPELLHYLLPSRYCQSDQLSGLAASIAGSLPENFQRVLAIRTWIHTNISRCPGSSDSSTSAVDTARTQLGICRDFAHLGIALCRAINVPARMVVGFLHELYPMDLHAWFEVYIGGRWFTLDPFESATRGGRIVVAYGRDAADVALATLFGPFSLQRMEVTVNTAPHAAF